MGSRTLLVNATIRRHLLYTFPSCASFTTDTHEGSSSSDWLIVLFTSVAIGQGNYFGFGFTTLNCMKTALIGNLQCSIIN